jgi:hypothetical protein
MSSAARAAGWLVYRHHDGYVVAARVAVAGAGTLGGVAAVAAGTRRGVAAVAAWAGSGTGFRGPSPPAGVAATRTPDTPIEVARSARAATAITRIRRPANSRVAAGESGRLRRRTAGLM